MNAGAGYLYEKTADGEWVLQHRLHMEKKLGRKLLPTERVHHKNGVRSDNEPRNLELWIVRGRSKKDPPGQRMEDLIAIFLEQPEVVQCKSGAEVALRRIFGLN